MITNRISPDTTWSLAVAWQQRIAQYEQPTYAPSLAWMIVGWMAAQLGRYGRSQAGLEDLVRQLGCHRDEAAWALEDLERVGILQRRHR